MSKWPDYQLEKQMLSDCACIELSDHPVARDLACHVRALLDRVRTLEISEEECEWFAAEVNRRRGEMAVAREAISDAGLPSERDGITLTMSQRIRMFENLAAEIVKHGYKIELSRSDCKPQWQCSLWHPELPDGIACPFGLGDTSYEALSEAKEQLPKELGL